MAKKNEKKENSIGDKVLKSVNDFAKRTLFIPSLVFDRIYSDVTGKPTDYNKALYASIDPTGQRPDFSINGVAEAIANTYKFLKKYYDRDFENIDYIKDTENIPLQNRVAIAAWAKYNKLPYDESLIIDNGDGTYSLPKEIEKSMRKDRSDIEKVYNINKKNYDKRRGDYEKRLDIARSNNDMSDYNKVRNEMEQDDELFYLKTAVNMDKKNLEATDSLMAGKPSVFNEFNYKNRNIRNIEENKGMLNVLGDHTLYKRDDGRIGYRDIYDLNQPFDFLLGGAPFYIRGVVGGASSNKVKKKQDGGSSEEDPMEDEMRRYYQDKRDEKRAKDWISNWLAKRVEILGRNTANTSASKFGDIFRSYENIGKRERKNQIDNMNRFNSYTHDYSLEGLPSDFLEELREDYSINKPIDEDYLSLLYKVNGVRGITYPMDDIIYYPSYPEDRVRIHENTHATENRIFIDTYNAQTSTIAKEFKNDYILDGIEESGYKDSSSEIYARLNEFRYLNNIDPKKVYTIEDVQKMREDKNTKDRELLNRYNDDFILFLLNEVAMTDGNDNNDVFYAKDGGNLNLKDFYSKRDKTSILPIYREVLLNSIGDDIVYNAGVLPMVNINADLSPEEYKSAMQKAASKRGRNYVYNGQKEMFEPILETVGTVADFVPVIGDAKAIGEAIVDIDKGDLVGAVEAGIFALPFVGDMAKISKARNVGKTLRGREKMRNDYEALKVFLSNSSKSNLPPFNEIKTEKELDDLFKKEIDRHRTFVRGVVADEDKSDDFLFNLAPKNTGAGRYGVALDDNSDSKYLYVSNSVDQAMGYASGEGYDGTNGWIGYMRIGPEVDFSSSDRMDWLIQADFDYGIADPRVAKEMSDVLRGDYGIVDKVGRSVPSYEDFVDFLAKRKGVNKNISQLDLDIKDVQKNIDNIKDELDKKGLISRNQRAWWNAFGRLEKEHKDVFDRMMNLASYETYLNKLKSSMKDGDIEKAFVLPEDEFIKFYSSYKSPEERANIKRGKMIDDFVSSKLENPMEKGVLLGGMDISYGDLFGDSGLRHFVVTNKDYIHPIKKEQIIDVDPGQYTRWHVGSFSEELSGKKFKDGGSVRKKQDYIYNRLVNEHGFAPIQAVAILANLTHESGLTDDILGDNGASYGLQQWKGPRRKNLFSFAKGKGHSKPTFEDQVDFLAHEYKNNQAFRFKNKGQNLYQEGKVNNDIFDYFQYSKADFDNAESLWDATIAWNQGVGRPNKKYAFNGRRYEIAVHLANRYGIDYGKERKYTDMGYSDAVQQEPVNTGDKKQDYYENYGKQILVNVLPAQTPSAVQSVSSSETNVEKKLDEDEEYNAEQIEAMRQEQEMEKRRALVAAFLPNIQLKIKGTSKTAN